MSKFIPFFCLIGQLWSWEFTLAGGDPPVVLDDRFTAEEGIPLFMDVIANDYDPDGDPLTVVLKDPTTTFCAGLPIADLVINNNDGSLIFLTPNSFTGSCTFQYRVNDGTQARAASVDIAILKTGTLAPGISVQPLTATVDMGGSGSFLIEASGPGNLTYVWQKHGVDLSETGRVSGVNTPALSITGTTLDDLHLYQCLVSNEFGETVSAPAGLVLRTDLGPSAPFPQRTTSLPVIIEAEQYDLGAEGVAFSDQTAGNSGGVWRTGSIDIAAASTDGFYVTDIQAGEWLAFTVDVPADGMYDLGAVVANQSTTVARFHWANGQGLALTCDQSVTLPGGPEDWVEVKASGVFLNAGLQVLRVVANGDGWTLDKVSVAASPAVAVQEPFSTPVPDITTGPIEVEAFDRGGRGLAWHDLSEGNSGDHCGRSPDWVDLQALQGGAVVLVDIEAGEWLEYTMRVPAEARYDITVHYQSDAPATAGLSIPGRPDSWAIPLPALASMGTITLADQSLPAGEHIFRLSFPTVGGPGLVLNKLEFQASQVFPLRVTDAGNNPVSKDQTIGVGSTEVNVPLVRTFTLHNDHPGLALAVDQASISGQGWSMTGPLPNSLPPSSSADFTVQLTSAAPIADTTGTINLVTSGATVEAFDFHLQGAVILSPTQARFDRAFPSMTPPLTYTDLIPGQTVTLPIQGEVSKLFLRASNLGNQNDLHVAARLSNGQFSVTPANRQVIPMGQGVFELDLLDHTTPGVVKTTVTLTGNFSGSPLVFDVAKVNIVGDPVTIVAQPQPVNVPEGSTAQVSVTAAGGSGSGFTYEWVRQGSVSDIDPTDPTDPYTGADTPTLTIDGASGQYFCIVRDADVQANLVQSESAGVHFYQPIAITGHPESIHTTPGNQVELFVTATGAHGKDDYRWQHKGVAGIWEDLQDNGVYTGTGDSRLVITNIQDPQVGGYRCRVYEPNIPENTSYSGAAFVSLLRFSQHPADAWGRGGEPVALNVGGLAGRTIAYQWFVNGKAVPGATGPSYTAHVADVVQSIDCEISDGFHQLRSRSGTLYPARAGLLAADSFNRGFLDRRPLAGGVVLPFGSQTWQATNNLAYLDGAVFNDQTLAANDIASIHYVPTAGHRMMLTWKANFGANPPAGAWLGVGFSATGNDFETDGQVWVRLTPGAVSGVHYQVYANGTSQLLASGQVDGTTNLWSLTYNPLHRTVALKNGHFFQLEGAGLTGGFQPNIGRAQFMFHAPAANPGSNGQDFSLTRLELYETEVFLAVDDFATVDVTAQSSIAIDILANDRGESLNFEEDTYPDRGLPYRAFVDGRMQMVYETRDQWVGEEQFIYRLTSALSGDIGKARVTVLRYAGFGFVGRTDELTVPADRAITFNPVANDFHSESGLLRLDETQPFPQLPAHGQVSVASEQQVVYTPNAGYLGEDSFTYKVVDEQGRHTTGLVHLYVARTFDGSFSDSFANTAGRPLGTPLHGALGQSGDFAWQELDSFYQAPFVFGEDEVTQVVGIQEGNFAGLRLHENLETLLSPLVEDDFDAGLTSAWSEIDADGMLAITAVNPISGSHSLAADFDGTSLAHRFLKATFDSTANPFRAKFKLDASGLQFAQSSGFLVMRLIGPSGWVMRCFITGDPGQKALYFQARKNDGSIMRSASFPLTGTHEVVLDWAPGGLGEARMLIDNQTLVEVPGFPNGQYQWNRFDLGAMSVKDAMTGTLRFDDVVVSSVTDVVTRWTFAFPDTAPTNDTALLRWVRFPDGIRKLNDGLHLQVAAGGGYEVWQTVNNGPTYTITQGSMPLGPGQPVRAELWYHPADRSVSVRLNGRQVAERVVLNRKGYISDWRTLGFHGEAPNSSGHLVVEEFALEAAPVPPGPLVDRLLFDSFTGTDGTGLNTRFSEEGNLRWYASGNLRLAQNRVVGTVDGSFVATLPFDPDHFQGQIFEASADIDPASSSWTGFGFTASHNKAFWKEGQLWVSLRDDGKYQVFWDGNLHRTQAWPIPGFSPGGINHVKIRYDRSIGIAQVEINGVPEQEIDLDADGFIPNIQYLGFHMRNTLAINSPTIDQIALHSDDGTRLPAGQMATLVYDGFPQPDLAALNGTSPLVGLDSWQADGDLVHREWAVSSGDISDATGAYPLIPAHYSGAVWAIEADVLLQNGASASLGFLAAPSAMAVNGQIWVSVSKTGTYQLWAGGTAQLLATGAVPNFDPNQFVNVQLWYDRNGQTASLWLGGQEVASALALAQYPDIRFGGLRIEGTAVDPAGGTRIDNFRIAVDDATPAAFADLVPAVSDSFTANTLLHGKVTESGNRTWQASSLLNSYRGEAVMFNLQQTGGRSLAGVDFDAGQYGGDLFTVESRFIIGSSIWMGVGFNSAYGYLGPAAGQIWTRLYPNGTVSLFATGTAGAIFSAPAKVFYPNGYNKVVVVYNRRDNTAGLVVNEVVEAMDLPLQGVPNIGSAVMDWNRANGAPLDSKADDFVIKIE